MERMDFGGVASHECGAVWPYGYSLPFAAIRTCQIKREFVAKLESSKLV